MTQHFLAIDQGTTSTRAMIFDKRANALGAHQIPFTQHFPENGWVEHDPQDIWETTLACCKNVLIKTNLSPEKITAIGITNQRETTIIWDKKTGEAIYPAIVWQDRRTAKYCDQLSHDKKIIELISNKTGLRIDAYFSATKIAWILDHVDHARERAEKGELAFGTIDTFLLWKFKKLNIDNRYSPEFFDMDSDFNELENEVVRIEQEISAESGVDFIKQGYITMIGGLEFLSKRQQISALKLTGLHNKIYYECQSSAKYNKCFNKIYEKYFSSTEMNPLLELSFLTLFAVLGQVQSNYLRNNPDIISDLMSGGNGNIKKKDEEKYQEDLEEPLENVEEILARMKKNKEESSEEKPKVIRRINK